MARDAEAKTSGESNNETTNYVVRHPSMDGTDFVMRIAAVNPRNAIERLHAEEWADLSGRTEVYNAEDVPDAADYSREKFPVGDADPILAVEVKPPVSKRHYKILDEEDKNKDEGEEWGEIELPTQPLP